MADRLACGDFLPVMCWRWGFPGRPDQVAQVREISRPLLAGHPLEGDILLVLSELLSNAIRHTRSARPGGLVVTEVRRWRRGVAVAVIDQGGPNEPVLRTAGETLDAFAEGGRGLLTVDAYATWWRWHGDARSRTVTAFFLR
ncbi:ATP-binding protein [Actinomadura yumaensis]|uniref:ATP-binding protein n=1 Tax=Actinomadura yumaensis TaxID=111807 RepID=UPI00366FAB70